MPEVGAVAPPPAAAPRARAALAALKRQVRLALLSRTARAVRRENLTMLGLSKLNRLEWTARGVIRWGVPGAFAEFGMALGGSGVILARIGRRAGREFHGFDVFGMIPPPDSEKDDARSKARYEEIAAGRSRGINGDTYYGYMDNLFDKVSEAFARHGLSAGDGVRLHKGLFADTVPTALPSPLAIAHIDCDWYEPTRYCLEQVAERLSVGGAIIVDDYHNYGGCRTATDEFLARAGGRFAVEDGDSAVLRRLA